MTGTKTREGEKDEDGGNHEGLVLAIAARVDRRHNETGHLFIPRSPMSIDRARNVYQSSPDISFGVSFS